ncbi:MAG: hypothetical protein IPN49_12770 [Saprospiraceae bacterium]|nr:hypothetical protein [Saprospiraceae bacterium]
MNIISGRVRVDRYSFMYGYVLIRTYDVFKTYFKRLGGIRSTQYKFIMISFHQNQRVTEDTVL